MPLAFPSKSHGTVAFGFFNIETDMLLLDRLFFFADRFCAAVIELAVGSEGDPKEAPLEGWRIEDPASLGDLHGAIAGVRLSGFIGETYRLWPFPSRPEGFKQNPEGVKTQATTRESIGRFGAPEEIVLARDAALGTVSVGEYRFDAEGFAMLIAYVDRGGYPRWRDEIRPAYVLEMMERLPALWP